MTIIATLLLALNSIAPTETHTVDVIEFNRVQYSGGGCLDQVILWSWWEGDYGYHADYWCHLGNVSKPARVNGKWQINIERGGRIVTVRARQFREIHSTYDRELADRESYPMEYRRWRQ